MTRQKDLQQPKQIVYLKYLLLLLLLYLFCYYCDEDELVRILVCFAGKIGIMFACMRSMSAFGMMNPLLHCDEFFTMNDLEMLNALYTVLNAFLMVKL